MTTRKIAVVSAGIGVPSSTRLLADRLAAATSGALADRGQDVRVEVVELREHAHELVDAVLTGFVAPGLRPAVDAVVGADALVAVTPTFSASYNGLFKLFFDALEEGVLDGKPTLVAATGGTGRHSLALEHAVRPLMAYLHAVVVPTAVFAAPEDWAGGSAGVPALDRRIARAAGELADLVAGRSATAAPDPFDTPVPFEQLLNGS
ncbi:FMN reductase [Pseudonocardia kunmingensis]|uniref:FMN reductase n=1 Tax=Pseudonocardia kunmingensis TaxID=630975 RepID=A0A543DW65_9PSEU|nr:FMN reductase [Pseudonocardia kunmingensis]TQM13562.1 FMN reductase [Pseudonocardia kunmingensis]